MGTSFQSHIQRLQQAGIATHLVENADAVDPLFALAKVRDFPQVTFAAVFENGSVVLGCHDTLPPQLQDIAQPIVATDERPSDDLMAKMDALHEAVRTSSDVAASDVMAQLSAIQATLDQQGQTAAQVADRLTEFENQFAESREAITAKLPDDGALETIATQLSALQDTIKDFSDHDALTAIRADLAALTAQGEAAPPDFEALLNQHANDIIAQVSNAFPKPAPITDLLDGQRMLQQSLAEVADTVQTMLTASTASDQAAHPALPDILDRLNQLTGLSDMVTQIPEQIAILGEKITAPDPQPDNHLAKQISDLSDQIAILGSRPDPVIDLTEQRQILARFQTAMSTVLSRLENQIECVSSLQQDDTVAQLRWDSVTEKMQALSESIAPLADLPNRIAAIDTQLQQLPEAQDAVLRTLNDLKRRPDPALDLTEQRQSLAQFASAVGTAVKRLEMVAEQLTHDKTDTDIMPTLARMEDLFRTTHAQDNQMDLGQALAAHGSEIAALKTDIVAYLERPAPAPDLTMQRASLARFATALGTVVSRFERIAAQFETVTETQPPPCADAAPPAAPLAPRPFAHADISFDALRTGLAELIAQQIMNSGSSNKMPCADPSKP